MDNQSLKVSYFTNITSTAPAETKTIEEIRQIIKSDKHKAHCEDIARLKQTHLADPADKAKEDKYKKRKLALPCFTASGVFSKRNNNGLLEHNGVAQIDLDGKDNPSKSISDMRDALESDPHVFLVLRSPSGDGVKGLCRVPADADTHKDSWEAMRERYTAQGFNVDSTPEVSRAFFVSHDPDIKSPRKFAEAKQYTPAPKPAPKPAPAPVARTYSDELSDLDKIDLCLPHLHPDDDYEQWFQVGMIIKSTGGAMSTWDAWSSQGSLYKAGEIESKWKSFKGGSLTIASLIKLATDACGGVNPIIKQRNSLSPVVDIKTDFADVGTSEPKTKKTEKAPKPIGYHCNGKYYFLDSDERRYLGVSSKPFELHLRSLGYSKASKNGVMSAVEKRLLHTITHHTVDHVGSIAGRSIGINIDGNGTKHLIDRKNKRAKAVKGEFPIIGAIVDSVFGEQSKYVYSWLNIARRQLSEERYMPGHALVIAGDAGGGKSLFSEAIAAPLLGSLAKASQYLRGATNFNADIVGSELLLLDDDMGSDRRAEKRAQFGESLKNITAGSKTVKCHGKGMDGYSANPLWRCIVCINADDQALGAFPPIGEGDSTSLSDKVLLLRCLSNGSLPFAGEANQTEKFENAIEQEIEAFAYYVDNYEIPKEIRTGKCRFGFDEFQHADLLQVVNQNSNERTLLSATNELLFTEEKNLGVTLHKCKLAQTPQRLYWQGTALEWREIMLKDDRHPARKVITSALAYGDSAEAAGKALAKVAEVADGRILSTRTRTGTIWKIYDLGGAVFEDDPF
jgi:hypothetical protein